MLPAERPGGLIAAEGPAAVGRPERLAEGGWVQQGPCGRRVAFIQHGLSLSPQRLFSHWGDQGHGGGRSPHRPDWRHLHWVLHWCPVCRGEECGAHQAASQGMGQGEPEPGDRQVGGGREARPGRQAVQPAETLRDPSSLEPKKKFFATPLFGSSAFVSACLPTWMQVGCRHLIWLPVKGNRGIL